MDNKQSSHQIYDVIPKEGENPERKKVGAAWQNKDGKGYSLDIELDIEGWRLVMREPFPGKDSDATSYTT